MIDRTIEHVCGEVIGDIGGVNGQLFYEDRRQGSRLSADNLDSLRQAATEEKQRLLDETASIRAYCYADKTKWSLRIYS